ncbi:MAG: hypothetical protein U9Q07_09085 [Planctomycetota bacterium]|nr:hypothetical protein [Planctomycetota bacterium]
MIEINVDELADVARQAHANLKVLQSQAKAEKPDMRTVAQIMSSTASLINDWTPIRIRHRWSPRHVSAEDVWRTVKSHVPNLAKFVTAHRVDPNQAKPLVKVTRNRLLAIGIILYGMLGCENIRRALHGDISRSVIAIDGSVTGFNPTGQTEELLMIVRVHLHLDRLPGDVRTILTNLRAIADEVAETPFNPVMVAELIGPIVNLVADHISLPPRTSPPGTMSSREWIKLATKDCLDSMGKLYNESLLRPNDEEARQKLRVRATHALVQMYVTYRDIYLAPDIQNALAVYDAERE